MQLTSVEVHLAETVSGHSGRAPLVTVKFAIYRGEVVNEEEERTAAEDDLHAGSRHLVQCKKVKN